ncbi:uncharacterized protein K444DRAFT_628892 [Hyaloscypha bicolor E]|uniref:MYND-type domain-containing protein n=1 Tax=Hyaloscypha bicolor E TaxID=1095630 RepID=A0A2J6TD14_9HELO|nr:uncharacterized protein K444DRAFT_628892 [Hyaloscypha bicolor E]PMD60858.1 hypothetical protein K444DRAFT_628892 [Hyaloscypha bicolor E]
MDIQSSTKISKCSICQNPTNLVCSGCSEDPLNENKKTRYCSRDCQSVDWPLHKRSCQMPRARVATGILEVPVDLKNHRREVVRTNHLNLRNMERHEVLRVVLKHGGEVYAPDIASAQYGFYKPVAVWDEFVDTRVNRFVWMEENRLSARNLLRLRKGEFELRETELLEFIKGRTRLDTELVQEAFEIIKGAAAEGRI